jgi:hypothetical protein
VVGVDEYATRKGRVYDTVLVDVETRRPVDLLPDREASSLAAWLAKRPGIEIVCRDRAPFFAEGATAGAPQATQVADRWHLWHNLGEAAERAVARHRQCLRVLVPDPERKADEPAPPVDKTDSPWRSERFANRVRDRHATVHALLEAGHSRRFIGRQLQMTHRTVKSLADAAKPEDLFRGQWQHSRISVLDEYKPYLEERWDEGCTNAWNLWEEILPLGYRGSYGRVSAYLREKRTSPRPVTAQPPAPRVVTRWILSRPRTLTEIERLQLKTVLANCPELEPGRSVLGGTTAAGPRAGRTSSAVRLSGARSVTSADRRGGRLGADVRVTGNFDRMSLHMDHCYGAVASAGGATG